MKIFKSYSSISILMITLLYIPSLLFAKAEDKIERTYTLDRDGRVYLEVKSGDVEVNSWDKNEVKIIAHKNATIDIYHTEGNIRIIVSRPQSFHYELFIPDKAHLRVETASGRVEAREIGGFVDVRTVSGDIKVITAENGIRCKTVSGDIHLEKITGNADLKTTSGKITVEGIKGSIKADTVSSKIEIEAFSHAEEMEIESISGNIKLRGELSPGGIYELNSHSGNVKIGIPSESNFELRVETFSGNIHCDFEIKMSGKIDRKKIQGVVGKGGTSLILSTFSGNIRITKR
jgi:DUF4097 and DUF4098 domain-containing protein YvlB